MWEAKIFTINSFLLYKLMGKNWSNMWAPSRQILGERGWNESFVMSLSGFFCSYSVFSFSFEIESKHSPSPPPPLLSPHSQKSLLPFSVVWLEASKCLFCEVAKRFCWTLSFFSKTIALFVWLQKLLCYDAIMMRWHKYHR